MTNNLFDGLVLFGPCFVAPHSDVVLFFDEKNTLFPKTTSKRPEKMMIGRRFWLFQMNPFQGGLLSFSGQGRSGKNQTESLMISAQTIKRLFPYWSLGSH